MRPRTLDDYSARIARAVALIETRAAGDEPPTLAELAEAAAMSPFHFHRVFRLMTGEALGAMVRRLRLARSLGALADGGQSITEASAGSGYATSQAYARAMRQATGASASEARSDPQTAERIAAALRRGEGGEAPLSVEVVSLEPFRVMALRRAGAYEKLDSGYGTLFEGVFAQRDPADLIAIWGVPLDDPFSLPQEELRFDCALELGGDAFDSPANEAQGIHAIALGGFSALHLRHVGSFDAVHAAFDRLYRAVLASGSLELGAAPPLIRYIDQPEDAPEEELRSDLYLPILAP